MVIVITGILGSMVAVFIKGSIDSYFDTTRRAELTDIADTALRRMSRDLRLAVPNTARVDPGNKYVEVLLAKAGGRYDADAATACFAAGCTNIKTTGSVVETFGAVTGVPAGPAGGRYAIGYFNTTPVGRIVIYNQYNNSGNDCSATNPSAYCGNNTSLLSGQPTDNGDSDVFNFASKAFVPIGGSPSRRFQIIDSPVTYACNPTAAAVNGVPANSLVRYASYSITAAQPVTAASGALAAGGILVGVVATNVSACSFTYSSGVFERWGVVGLYLQLTEHGETVSLYQEVHINNGP